MLTAGFGWTNRDDLEDTQRFIIRTKAGISGKMTPRLKLGFGGGLNFINTRKDDLFTGNRDSHFTTGFSLDATADYELKTLSTSLAARYGLVEGSLGDLQNEASLSASVTQLINERSKFNLAASMLYTSPLASSSSNVFSFSVSPSYILDLTEYWSLETGYRFIHKSASGTKSNSNEVFLTLTRDFKTGP